MSNLGGYQTLVTWAKRLGGPKRASALVISAVAGVTVVSTKTLDRLTGRDRRLDDTSSAQSTNGSVSVKDLKVYTVHTETDCGKGLVLQPADTFVVFARDRDTAFIEVHGHSDNPFAVSAQLLSEASDFEH